MYIRLCGLICYTTEYMKDDILSFIKQQRSLGMSDAVIRERLQKAGHADKHIHEALGAPDLEVIPAQTQMHSLLPAWMLMSRARAFKKKYFWDVVQVMAIPAFSVIALLIARLFFNEVRFVQSPLLTVSYLSLLVMLGVIAVVSYAHAYARLVMMIDDPKALPADISRRAWRFVGPLFGIKITLFFLLVPGLFAGILPGMVLALWSVFAAMIVVVERGGIMESLLMSRNAVRGIFFRVLWRLCVACFVAGISWGALTIIMYPVILISARVHEIVSIISVYGLLYFFLVPLLTFYLYYMYANAKLYRKGVLAPSKKLRVTYWILVGLGAFMIIYPALSVVITLASGNSITFQGEEIRWR